MDETQNESPNVVLGLEQLQYLSDVTEALNDLTLPSGTGLELRVAVMENTTKNTIGLWHNIENREWQLQIVN